MNDPEEHQMVSQTSEIAITPDIYKLRNYF